MDQGGSGTYADELAARARGAGLVVGLVALVAVPAWGAFDLVLEPERARAFVALRLTCELPLLGFLWLLWRHPLGRRRPELLAFLLLAVVQAEISWMVVRASSAREFYLLGFSLAVYASGCVLGGPLRWTAALVGVTWLSFGLALLTAPAPLPGTDLTASVFYLATASVIGLLAHAQRDRLSRNELAARAGLEQEQRRTQQLLVELERLSNEDALTGLANRRRWDTAIAAACAVARESGTAVTAVLADVDRFKQVNDDCGHAGGDAVLTEVAAAVSGGFGPEALVARLGGDEIGVLLPGSALAEACALAERVRQAVAALRPPPGARAPLSVSMGVADVAGAEASPEELMRRTDEQLYLAKQRRDAVRARLAAPRVPQQRAAEPVEALGPHARRFRR